MKNSDGVFVYIGTQYAVWGVTLQYTTKLRVFVLYCSITLMPIGVSTVQKQKSESCVNISSAPDEDVLL